MLMKVFLFGALFFAFVPVFAQRETTNAMLDRVAKQLADRSLVADFNRTVAFVRQQNWDSVLICTNKVLSRKVNAEIRDFAHYYRGEAFYKKRIYPQAMKELQAVSRQFAFYFKVDLLQGEMLLEQEKFNAALRRFQSIDTTDAVQLKSIRLDGIQHNIGLCYFHIGEYAKAEDYMLRAIPKIERENDYNSLIVSYMDLANVYYEQYLDEQAIAYFEKAYAISKKHGSFLLKQNAALNMAVVEENRSQPVAALTYRKEYEMWRDSLNDQNKIYDVAQLENKFEVAQKQREVKLLQTENRLKQTELNMYLFAALVLLLILLFGIYFYRQNVKRSRIILQQKQELDVLNATKDQLFSIVSHDLRSSVHALRNSNTSLKDQLSAKAYDEVEQQLEQNSSIATNTYNMLDNLLHWALLQTQGGYFKQEEHRLFMLVEQVVYNFRGLLNQNECTFENKIPRSAKAFVDAESIKIVLRNFLDNSIKFSEPGSVIQVNCIREDEQCIVLEWSDTGKGMSEETRLKLLSNSPQLTKKDHEKTIGSGLGMNLCKSMIEKNGGALDIWSERNVGTKMIVTLRKVSTDGAH